MANPQTHAPASDSDAVSFGEMSSDYDSMEEDVQTKSAAEPQHEDEPTLDNDGFEFSPGNEAPNLETDGFEFVNADSSFFPTAGRFSAEQGSVHTVPDADEQPSAEYTSFEQSTKSPQESRRRKEKGALGVLYCGTCDRLFGNEKVFKRHFMFGVKHGAEPRDMRDLYYRVWGQSWADEVKGLEKLGRVAEVDEMEI
jgi:hypothetical protein